MKKVHCGGGKKNNQKDAEKRMRGGESFIRTALRRISSGALWQSSVRNRVRKKKIRGEKKREEKNTVAYPLEGGGVGREGERDCGWRTDSRGPEITGSLTPKQPVGGKSGPVRGSKPSQKPTCCNDRKKWKKEKRQSGMQ